MGQLWIGMTTAARASGCDYFYKSIPDLRRAGFNEPLHLFAEPSTPSTKKVRPYDLVVVRHDVRKGCFQNWRFGATQLYEKASPGDWILMLQDDVIWRNDGAAVLRDAMEAFAADAELGMLSPYTSPAMVSPKHRRLQEQWCDARFHNKSFWGALAICIPYDALGKLLAHQRFVTHSHTRKLDVVLGNVFRRELALKVKIRVPSLCHHIGAFSTLGRHRIKGVAWGRKGFKFKATQG